MILITGASQGIGFECAKVLLTRTDSIVMITGRSSTRLEQARAAVPEAQRGRLILRVSDQSRLEDVEALGIELADTATPLEGAILGVGVNPLFTEGPQRLHAVDPAIVDAVIRTNCTHTLRLSAIILERFRRQRSGVLIWIGSQGYRTGLPGAGVYCASKAFLTGLAHTAHHEYSDRGVRVQLVNPGLVLTPRTARIVNRFAAQRDKVIEDAGEVAALIVTSFLASEPQPVEVDL